MSTVFGSGVDGNVTISTDTSLTDDVLYNNLTVNTGISLRSNGYVIRVLNTLSLFGTIQNNATGSSNPGSTGTIGGGVCGNGTIRKFILGGGAGIGNCEAPPCGVNAILKDKNVYFPRIYTYYPNIIDVAGGRASDAVDILYGGGCGTGCAGAGGGIVLIFANTVTGSGSIEANGSGGGGGAILMYSTSTQNSITLSVTGSAGAGNTSWLTI